MRKCQGCGKEFLPRWQGKGRQKEKWCGENCRKRAWELREAKQCADCGKTIGWRSSRCHECHFAKKEAGTQEKRQRVQALWQEGYSLKEIATAEESTPNAIGVFIDTAKKKGWDFPPRRPNWKGHTKPGGPKRKATKTKTQARQRLTNAVRNGHVVRPPNCEECNREGHVDAHHHDYSKPLDVRWLCRGCHTALHQAERQPANV